MSAEPVDAPKIGSVYSTPRWCLPCGKEFLPVRRPIDKFNGVQEYCSDDCRKRAHQRQYNPADKAIPQPRFVDNLPRFPERAVRHRPPSKPFSPRVPRDYEAIRAKNIQKVQARETTPPWGHLMMRLRFQRNWSREMLAAKVGVSKNSIANWEQGIREPSISDFVKIAQTLEIGIERLWRGENPVKEGTDQ